MVRQLKQICGPLSVPGDVHDSASIFADVLMAKDIIIFLLQYLSL